MHLSWDDTTGDQGLRREVTHREREGADKEGGHADSLASSASISARANLRAPPTVRVALILPARSQRRSVSTLTPMVRAASPIVSRSFVVVMGPEHTHIYATRIQQHAGWMNILDRLAHANLDMHMLIP